MQASRSGERGMIHYELMLLYSIGLKPKDCISRFGFSRGSAYRFYRIYRLARKRAESIILDRSSVSPGRESKAKNLDALTRKKSVSPKETWEWEIGENGVTKARKKKND